MTETKVNRLGPQELIIFIHTEKTGSLYNKIEDKIYAFISENRMSRHNSIFRLLFNIIFKM